MAHTSGTGSVRKLPSVNFSVQWVEGVDPLIGERILRSETVEERKIPDSRKMVARQASAQKITPRM